MKFKKKRKKKKEETVTVFFFLLIFYFSSFKRALCIDLDLNLCMIVWISLFVIFLRSFCRNFNFVCSSFHSSWIIFVLFLFLLRQKKDKNTELSTSQNKTIFIVGFCFGTAFIKSHHFKVPTKNGQKKICKIIFCFNEFDRLYVNDSDINLMFSNYVFLFRFFVSFLYLTL